MFSDPIQFIVLIIALLLTLTVHEASHALVAYYLGDPTAKLRGRLTLNPVKHLDAVGSIIFLLTQSIGWGKPVPVDPRNFNKPIRDNALTALAGPVSNFVFAFALTLPIKFLGAYTPEFIDLILWMTFHVNIFLGLFNLFPFPPLDGSKILGLFVPKKFQRQYQNYLENGMPIFVAIIVIDVFILGRWFDYSVFAHVIGFLHERVSLVLLLGA